MSSADSKDRESTREQSDDDRDDAGEAARSDEADEYSEAGGEREGGTWYPAVATDRGWHLLCISRSLRALKLSFSKRSLALASSSCFSFSSISSIFILFLSLAFCAATLFFSFLLFNFSSGVMWSKLALFLTGWPSSELTIDMSVDGLLTAEAAAGTTMLEGGFAVGILMVFDPLFICWRKLLGSTMIWPWIWPSLERT